MAEEPSVFGLRFGSNADLAPSREELDRFLSSPKKPGLRTTHEDDLASFRDVVRLVAEYDRDALQEILGSQSIRDRMFYSVLSYSSLFSPLLLYSIELYKYYLNDFSSLDFRKPEAFIAAARQEMAGLNPRNKHDADKLAKLERLVAEREDSIAIRNKKREELPRELSDIMAYVRDNIARISGRCEKAIVILVQLAVDGSEERRLIRDIKNQFEQALRDGGDFGPVTRDDLEAVRQDLPVLSKEIADLMREDVYALSSLYEALQEHTKTIAERLSQLLTEADTARVQGGEAERALFFRGEEALLALVSSLDLKFKLVKPVSKTTHVWLLKAKREEMLASFQEHARKERRAREDRRSGRERRRRKDPDFIEPEKRNGSERRTGKGRRRT